MNQPITVISLSAADSLWSISSPPKPKKSPLLSIGAQFVEIIYSDCCCFKWSQAIMVKAHKKVKCRWSLISFWRVVPSWALYLIIPYSFCPRPSCAPLTSHFPTVISFLLISFFLNTYHSSFWFLLSFCLFWTLLADDSFHVRTIQTDPV